MDTASINIDDYPQLKAVAWNRPAGTVVPGVEALALYERNWRHVEQKALTPVELNLIRELADKYGHGCLNV
jgi:hypothetical protein